ncbi:sugar O-acetyltransferase [Clostridium paraputrificum]|uniref:sugar O-acetyltransferase n=1 Tax=Clostridium TaxID=1485 RepID=UPI003D341FDE
MTELEKKYNGELFHSVWEDVEEDMTRTRDILFEYNAKHPSEIKQNDPLLLKLFGKVGTCFISQPFKCEYGRNIEIGDSFFANFDCMMLDSGKITIGNHVCFGPRVTLITVGHPVDTELRNEGYQYAFPINIEDNVWIGAGTIVNPGVTIGHDTVIGSGSVVTKDIPSGVVAVGNPCRVLRPINEEDKKRYFKDRYIKE